MSWLRRPAATSPPTPEVPRLDTDEAKAFTEQARWLHAYHDKRSDVVAARAATVLGFLGVITTLLLGGLNFGKGSIRFTWPVRVNVVLVLVSVVFSAFFCLRSITLRVASVPKGKQLREQWLTYAGGGLRGLVHAQIAHSYLGAEHDAIADAKSEADSRAKSYKKAVRCFGTALLALAVLALQALLQQVDGG